MMGELGGGEGGRRTKWLVIRPADGFISDEETERGREAGRGDYIDVSGWVTDRFTGARKIFLFFFVIEVARLFLTSNVHNRTHNMSSGQVVDIISLYEE